MNSPFNPKPLLVAGAIVGSLLGGIAVGATTLAPTIASAATTTLAATASPGAGSSAAPPAMPAHGTPEHENAETAVTGDNATKAQAAAVKAVGGGTAGAVSTDFTKNGYEVTVTKSDGSTVEVHLDGNFNALPIR